MVSLNGHEVGDLGALHVDDGQVLPGADLDGSAVGGRHDHLATHGVSHVAARAPMLAHFARPVQGREGNRGGERRTELLGPRRVKPPRSRRRQPRPTGEPALARSVARLASPHGTRPRRSYEGCQPRANCESVSASWGRDRKPLTTRRLAMHYCGLDVSRKSTHVYIEDAQGRRVTRGIVATTPRAWPRPWNATPRGACGSRSKRATRRCGSWTYYVDQPQPVRGVPRAFLGTSVHAKVAGCCRYWSRRA